MLDVDVGPCRLPKQIVKAHFEVKLTDDTMGLESVLPGTLILEQDDSVWIILATLDDAELEIGHSLDGSTRITKWNERVIVPHHQTRISFDGEAIT